MVIIVVVLAGWFFIRNAIIHNGDPFGMATEERNRQELIDQGIEVFRYARPSETEGNTILKMLVNEDCHWMRVSQKSVIGVFGYMNMFLQEKVYYFYYSIFGMGIVLYGLTLLYGRKEKHNSAAIIVMITAAAITFFLSVWQSFYRDYQPQGRYIITVILPLAYMLSRAGDRITVSFQQKNTESTGRDSQTTALSVCFILLWIGMFFRIFFETMTKMFTA